MSWSLVNKNYCAAFTKPCIRAQSWRNCLFLANATLNGCKMGAASSYVSFGGKYQVKAVVRFLISLIVWNSMLLDPSNFQNFYWNEFSSIAELFLARFHWNVKFNNMHAPLCANLQLNWQRITQSNQANCTAVSHPISMMLPVLLYM